MKQSQSTEVRCASRARKGLIVLILSVVCGLLLAFKPYWAVPLLPFVAYTIYDLIFGREVILTLTRTGITDHRTPFGEIPWLKVEHVGLRMNGNQLVVAINEVSWELLLEKLSKFKAFSYQANLPGDIIFISKYSIDMPLKQLYDLIAEYADPAQQGPSESVGEAKS